MPSCCRTASASRRPSLAATGPTKRLAELRKTYRQLDPGPDDGRLDFTPYLAATVAHRDDLAAGRVTTEAVASQEKLNPKYLQILWQTLTDRTPSFPLDRIRAHWRQARRRTTGAGRRGPFLAGVSVEVQQDRQLHESRLAGRRQSFVYRVVEPTRRERPARLGPAAAVQKRLDAGFDAFRRCFPVYLYHGKIVPDDEIICCACSSAKTTH